MPCWSLKSRNKMTITFSVKSITQSTSGLRSLTLEHRSRKEISHEHFSSEESLTAFEKICRHHSDQFQRAGTAAARIMQSASARIAADRAQSELPSVPDSGQRCALSAVIDESHTRRHCG